MSIEPKPGMVIRFDYLWRDEKMKGREDGAKDRPCVIVVTTKERDDDSKRVLVCPITHSPPEDGQTAVEVPQKLARALNLDSEQMWIKTHELNSFTWEKGRLPVGMMKTPGGAWVYGTMPFAIREKTLDQVRENSRNNVLAQVTRNETPGSS